MHLFFENMQQQCDLYCCCMLDSAKKKKKTKKKPSHSAIMGSLCELMDPRLSNPTRRSCLVHWPASWHCRHRLEIWLAIATDDVYSLPAHRSQQCCCFRMYRTWQYKPSEIWSDKNSTIRYNTGSSATFLCMFRSAVKASLARAAHHCLLMTCSTMTNAAVHSWRCLNLYSDLPAAVPATTWNPNVCVGIVQRITV